MTLRFHVSVQGFDELQRVADDPLTVGRPAREFLENAIEDVKRETDKKTPVRTGRLRSGNTTEVDPRIIPLWAALYTMVPYAPFLEFGVLQKGFRLSGALKGQIRGKRSRQRKSALVRAGVTRWRIRPRGMYRRGLRAATPDIDRRVEQFADALRRAWGI